jgi:hypothetical protein
MIMIIIMMTMMTVMIMMAALLLLYYGDPSRFRVPFVVSNLFPPAQNPALFQVVFLVRIRQV